MRKRRTLLLFITGLSFTNFVNSSVLSKSTVQIKKFLIVCNGQNYPIDGDEKVKPLYLPPNQLVKLVIHYSESNRANLVLEKVFRVPCVPTKPILISLVEKDIMLLLYPKGKPWQENLSANT